MADFRSCKFGNPCTLELSVKSVTCGSFCQQLNYIFAVYLHVGSSSFYCIYFAVHIYD